MHVVIIGLGEVGTYLVKEFEKDGHDIVAIDQNPAVVHRFEEQDVAAEVGYGASEKVLEKAGVSRADLVVAVTDHDEVNVVAALIAKDAGAKRVVARTQGDFAESPDGVRYGFLGIDLTINPSILVAQELVKLARSHGAVEVIDLSQGRIDLVQVEVTERSKFVHRPIASVPIKDVLVAAVVRKNELFVPGGTDNLLPGDRLYLVGKPADLPAAEDLFTARREKTKRACIAGGSRTGERVARALIEDGAEVKIFESNPERAHRLGDLLPESAVFHGDATDTQALLDEGVGSADLFLAVTGNDGVNLMAALLAKRMGIPQTAALVQRQEAVSIYKQLGLDIVVSPRTVASSYILRYSRKSEVKRLTQLQEGLAEVLEIDAVHGSRAVGTPIRQLNLPRGTLICAIVHDDQVIIPRGDDHISVGDSVIVLVTKGARSTVERLFRPGLL